MCTRKKDVERLSCGFEEQHKLCQPQQISDELCWQNVGNFIKAKILTVHF